ncbi:protein-L-isoaspartate(D-aspartate) O-methyltransferase [Kineosphaera limosa]|nr:methyltransferase domain-containing protein [Kineosphaera limosa]NYE00571.1 protein-L-isoaspartate(D-aspartate) O-methyltransferase [Kineosphaera limosa]
MTGDQHSREAHPAVDEAFAATPRQDYLPDAVRHLAHHDLPLPLARGMTNSQPSTVRDMLEHLQVPAGARVLDVGSGSGWSTALLAHLCGPKGRVLGLEIEPELVAFGTRNLAASCRDWARIEAATPGVLGAPDRAPFDRILVSAMATDVPTDLVNQLAPCGVLVVPVKGRMVRIHVDDAGTAHRRAFGFYRFVPLR